MHLRAEVCDRPLAYALRAEMLARLAQRFPNGRPPLDPLVCTDVWLLNDDDLRRCPSVSIGGPGVNAYTASLAESLPSVFVIDDRLIVQADTEWVDMNVCCWGADHQNTVLAVQAFIDRYLEPFLEAALRATEAEF